VLSPPADDGNDGGDGCGGGGGGGGGHRGHDASSQFDFGAPFAEGATCTCCCMRHSNTKASHAMDQELDALMADKGALMAQLAAARTDAEKAAVWASVHAYTPPQQ
jgi:hypothetical protein